MQISVLPGRELTPDHVSAWRNVQELNPELASPYFCPEFTQAVAAVRNDVFVTVMQEAGEYVGFFPFQRQRHGVGAPVGGPLSDFHGVIAAPHHAPPVEDLFRASSLTAWDFHHLLASQEAFRPFHQRVSESHLIDLTQGFSGYEAGLRSSGSHLMKDFRAKLSWLKRNHGEVRFEPHVSDAGVLTTLRHWKSRQYQSSGLIDVLGFDWAARLLERIHATQTEHFAGMLSALYVGGELAAVHMGMRSANVWNWWFPRHDQRFAKGSPGILLRLFAAQAAEEFGVSRIDLGMGDATTYKPRLATGNIPLAEGRIELPSLTTAARRLRRGAEAWIRRSPLLPIARVPGRVLKRAERRRRFR